MNRGRAETVFPYITALRAQRLLGLSAFRIAPALAAGAMAASHLNSIGKGLLLFIAMIAASALLGRERLPMHLMPLASFFVLAFVPVAGATLAVATGVLVGEHESVSAYVAPVIGAWIVMAFAAWGTARFDHARRVRIAVIGSEELARGLAEELSSTDIRAYSVVGWLAGSDPAVAARGAGGTRRLGSLTQLRQVVRDHSIDLLVHGPNQSPEGDETPYHSRLEVFERVAAACLDLPVRLIEASQLYEELFGHVPLGQSNSAWFQYLLHPRYRASSPAYKRAFDVIFATGMLIVLAPLLAALAIAIKVGDGGAVLYRQRRVGEGGQGIEMIKFRSMRTDAEADGPRWAAAEDDRVTTIGRLMRRTHIDELPQLWNVIRGEMTLVGPRPERRELIAELERQLPYYDRRQLVKPGIAGWAQARCGYGGSEEGTGWKLCHDLFYLKHRSLYFDLLVLIESVRVSLQGSVQFDVRAPQEQFILRQAQN